MLEGVKSSATMARGDQESDLDGVLRRLRAGLPVTWIVTMLHKDSKVAEQRRPLIYIVSHARAEGRGSVGGHERLDHGHAPR